MANDNRRPMMTSLCSVLINRMATKGLTGSARDAATIEFMTGATAALMASGHDEATQVFNASTTIARNGFSEVERIAAGR